MLLYMCWVGDVYKCMCACQYARVSVCVPLCVCLCVCVPVCVHKSQRKVCPALLFSALFLSVRVSHRTWSEADTSTSNP